MSHPLLRAAEAGQIPEGGLQVAADLGDAQAVEALGLEPTREVDWLEAAAGWSLPALVRAGRALLEVALRELPKEKGSPLGPWGPYHVLGHLDDPEALPAKAGRCEEAWNDLAHHDGAHDVLHAGATYLAWAVLEQRSEHGVIAVRGLAKGLAERAVDPRDTAAPALMAWALAAVRVPPMEAPPSPTWPPKAPPLPTPRRVLDVALRKGAGPVQLGADRVVVADLRMQFALPSGEEQPLPVKKGVVTLGPEGLLFVVDGPVARAVEADGRERWAVSLPFTKARVAVRGDGRLVAFGGREGVHVVRVDDGLPAARWRWPTRPLLASMGWSADGALLTLYDGKRVRRLSPSTGAIHRPNWGSGGAAGGAVHPTAPWEVRVSNQGVTSVVDLRADKDLGGHWLGTWTKSGRRVGDSLAWSADGGWVLAATEQGVVACPPSRARPPVIVPFDTPPDKVAIDAKGPWLAVWTSGAKGRLQVFEMARE